MDKVIFAIKDVYFSYLGKYPALQKLNLSINEGEKITVIGANGSGKSTFLHLLDGLILPDKGSISFFGRELTEKFFNDEAASAGFRKKVGLVFQNPEVQLFCPTVKEDIVFGPLQLGVPHEEVEIRLKEISALFKIEHLLERAPHQLSIGEKKKVAIASVLAIAPDVLLLDEPTAGLDPRTTRDIVDIIMSESEKGKAVITSTHDLHMVEEIGGTVHVFGEDNTIVRSGTAEEILSDAAFLEAHNLVHVHKHYHEGTLHTHPHLHHHAHHDDTHRF